MWECCITIRLKRMNPPTSRTIAPIVSPRLQLRRNARPRGPVVHSAAPAIANAAGMVTNWLRTSGATTTARPAHTKARGCAVASARTISQEQSANQG